MPSPEPLLYLWTWWYMIYCIYFLIQFEVEVLPIVDESILTDWLGDEISCLIGFHKWKQISASQDMFSHRIHVWKTKTLSPCCVAQMSSSSFFFPGHTESLRAQQESLNKFPFLSLFLLKICVTAAVWFLIQHWSQARG